MDNSAPLDGSSNTIDQTNAGSKSNATSSSSSSPAQGKPVKEQPRASGGRGGRGSANRSTGGRGRGNNIANLSGKAFFSGNSGTIGAKPGVRVKETAGQIKIKQEKEQASEHIEGLVAAEDAVGLAAASWVGVEDVGVRRGRLSLKGKSQRGEAGAFQFNIPGDDASSASDEESMDIVAINEAAQFQEHHPFSLTP